MYNSLPPDRFHTPGDSFVRPPGFATFELRRGNSLIDVLAVLGALFVASTLIIVAMNRARVSSRRLHSERQLQQAFQGLEQYVSTHRTLPAIPRPPASKRVAVPPAVPADTTQSR